MYIHMDIHFNVTRLFPAMQVLLCRYIQINLRSKGDGNSHDYKRRLSNINLLYQATGIEV
jgi:hypothetical protein